MAKILVLLICLIMLGLLVEKLIHIDYDITQVTFALKNDMKKFLDALLSEPKKRHAFDFTLVDDIKLVTKPYAKAGFDIQLANQMFRNVPVIAVRFVPDHSLEKDELQELVKLLLIKFREYMAYYGVNWRNFGTYSIGSDYTNIFLYYAEWESDWPSFINAYRQMIRQKAGKSGGILRDEKLDEELKRVDKNRI